MCCDCEELDEVFEPTQTNCCLLSKCDHLIRLIPGARFHCCSSSLPPLKHALISYLVHHRMHQHSPSKCPLVLHKLPWHSSAENLASSPVCAKQIMLKSSFRPRTRSHKQVRTTSLGSDSEESLAANFNCLNLMKNNLISADSNVTIDLTDSGVRMEVVKLPKWECKRRSPRNRLLALRYASEEFCSCNRLPVCCPSSPPSYHEAVFGQPLICCRSCHSCKEPLMFCCRCQSARSPVPSTQHQMVYIPEPIRVPRAADPCNSLRTCLVPINELRNCESWPR
ncbi:hypothetical protein Ciccas_001038 [Cichlidogyrus casuarinus]|uniref:Uncharacterized protein n=1 Tax=Cichlidogyrus casuarinus TaxID=1844966 RepID=A0ABD2QL54_9PLAT